MELNKFHILQREPLARDHAATIACAGMGRGCREIGAAITARGQHHHLGVERMQRAVIKFPSQNALALAIVRHDQIGCEILDIEFRVILERLAIKRVQHGMARAVSRRAGALNGRAFAKLGCVPAKGTLVNLALFGARERHAVMLKLINRLGGLTGEIFHRIRITEPVRPFHGVIHMPLPVIGAHIGQRCCNTTLGRNCVRTGGENLCHTGCFQPLFRQAEGRAQTRAARTDYDGVLIVMGDVIGSGHFLVCSSCLKARSSPAR